jgi:DNA-binding GntR family transcriptional regulator
MLTTKIVDSICNAIYHRKLLPGTKLNERDIAELFGVSRSIVRQALIRLSQDGLVEISPKRSSVVWRPTFEDAFELYQMLLVLESGVIDQLVKTITREQLKLLHEHTNKEKDVFQKGDHDLGDKLGREFHTLLVSFLGNLMISQIHSQIRRREALITAMFKVEFDYCQLRGEHSRLVECLEQRDAEAAKVILEQHYTLVIKGYSFDISAPPSVDLRSALGLA